MTWRRGFWHRLPDLGHDEVCAVLFSRGFRLDGFSDRLSRRLSLAPWANDGEEDDGEGRINETLIRAVSSLLLRPDAYRIRVEGPAHGWNRPVLACDVIEVVHSSAPDELKLRRYGEIWRIADASDRVSIRFWGTSHGTVFIPMFPAYTRGWDDVEFPASVSLDELLNLRLPVAA